jgi:hypothetical protein
MIDGDVLKPLAQGWLGKIDSARAARSKWEEISSECMMFYARSAAAMWDEKYTRKVWSGVKAPKFRITINKAFELVAIFAPNLLWEVPHRTVEPKKPIPIPPELFGEDQESQFIYQTLQQESSQDQARDTVVSHLMQTWLNYTPREQPGGGLMGHSEMAVLDALIKGRGVMWSRPYTFPGSNRTLTGSFREPPERLFIDPDFNSLDEAKWVALQHIEPYWAVEKRFQLPKGALKGKASLESSWSYGESAGSEDRLNPNRAAGQTNDLVVWYEIYSKTGPGARLTGMHTVVKEHLEEVVGDYAYIAICANVPYPLNCPGEELRKGISDDEVRSRFSWPIPLWADDKWPCQTLDFYPDPENAWPIPPIAPGLGELKFLNFMIPWLANRTYQTSRMFWAVSGAHVDHYRKYLEDGPDLAIIPTPAGVSADDVKKTIQILEAAQVNRDAWTIVEVISEMFDKRTGLTEFAYGRNESGTQDRTAETTMQRARAVGVRPEHMQKKVVSFQSELASTEAFLTRWFVKGQDVEPLFGRGGRWLWEKFIMATDVELVVRQMQYTIASSSIRRPNRERDIANFQQVSQIFVPVMQDYGASTGNYAPFNYLMKKWGEYHDTDLDGAEIPPAETNEKQQQMQEMQLQLEFDKLQAEVETQKAETEGKFLDFELEQQKAGMEMQVEQQKLQTEQQKTAMDIAAKRQSMLFDLQKGRMELAQDQQRHSQEMSQQKQMGKVKQQVAKQAAKTNGKAKANGSKR